eukprot:3304781-Rhodomonas_salina.1
MPLCTRIALPRSAHSTIPLYTHVAAYPARTPYQCGTDNLLRCCTPIWAGTDAVLQRCTYWRVAVLPRYLLTCCVPTRARRHLALRDPVPACLLLRLHGGHLELRHPP